MTEAQIRNEVAEELDYIAGLIEERAEIYDGTEGEEIAGMLRTWKHDLQSGAKHQRSMVARLEGVR